MLISAVSTAIAFDPLCATGFASAGPSIALRLHPGTVEPVGGRTNEWRQIRVAYVFEIETSTRPFPFGRPHAETSPHRIRMNVVDAGFNCGGAEQVAVEACPACQNRKQCLSGRSRTVSFSSSGAFASRSSCLIAFEVGCFVRPRTRPTLAPE